MHACCCTVSAFYGVNGNLELTWQESKFWVESRPLTNNFAIRARVHQLFSNHTGIFIGRSITNTVTTGLNRVHLNFRQLTQNLWAFFKLRPIELEVLTGTYVGIAAIVITGHFGQLAQLLTIKHAVRHSNTQHRCIALNVDAVL